MSEIPHVVTWMGRPIESLSRDELIEVIDWFAAEHRRQEACRVQERGMWREFIKAARGIR